MEITKLNLVYFSATYTTKRIIKAIGAEWKGDIKEYDITLDYPPEDILFDKDELVAIAMPVYAGRIPALAVPVLQRFKGTQTPVILIVVYGNRDYDDALLEIKNIAVTNGFKPISAGAFIAQHAIFPLVGNGRPDLSDKEYLATFAEKSFSLLERIPDTTNLPDLQVKGNYPYKVPGNIPLKPKGDKLCNECNTCIRLCPVQAIKVKNPRKTNTKICIACGRCVLVCPQKSRKFRGLLYKIARKKFVATYSGRKEPEVLYVAIAGD